MKKSPARNHLGKRTISHSTLAKKSPCRFETLERRQHLSAQYVITGFGSEAFGINDYGEVAVDNSIFSNGVMKDLGTVQGATVETVFGINNHHQAVGEALDDAGQNVAFIYDHGLKLLGGLRGYLNSFATTINDRGQILGHSYNPSDGLDGQAGHAFLYSNGHIAELGSLPGWPYDGASGINNRGQIAANTEDSSGVDGIAFLISDGHKIPLGTLPGDNNSIAKAINASGQIVGLSSGQTTMHAFLYSNGRMTGLGALPGDYASAVFGINDRGQVVGESEGSTQRGFLYSNGVMQDLNDLIPPNSGWQLLRAAGINNKGQIIGDGVDPQGKPEAFLLNRTKLVFATQPTTTVAGKAMTSSVVVKIENIDGQMMTKSNSPVTITLQAGADTKQVTVHAHHGVARFAKLTFQKAGTFRLVAGDASDAPATSAKFSVLPAAANRLRISTAPANPLSARTFAVRVAVEDAFGNLLTGNDGTMSLSIGLTRPSGDYLGSVKDQNVFNGIATFNNLSVSATENYLIESTFRMKHTRISSAVLLYL